MISLSISISLDSRLIGYQQVLYVYTLFQHIMEILTQDSYYTRENRPNQSLPPRFLQPDSGQASSRNGQILCGCLRPLEHPDWMLYSGDMRPKTDLIEEVSR
jgi:hypothetical protein